MRVCVVPEVTSGAAAALRHRWWRPPPSWVPSACPRRAARTGKQILCAYSLGREIWAAKQRLQEVDGFEQEDLQAL
eukprot:4745589-Lingulodinium_polyedra.AAC.1